MKHYLTIGQAAQRSPGRPSANAVWRWCRKGILSRSGRRIRLNHTRVGGRLFIDPESLSQFFREVAEADAMYFDRSVEAVPLPRPENLARRQRQIDQAEAELSAAGI
jgi:hypothetical protein